MHTLPFLTEKWTVLPFLVSACGLFLFLSFRGGVAASRVSSRLSPVVAVFHPRCHLLSFSLLELHCGAYTTPVYSVSDELAHLRGHFRGGVVPLSLVFPPGDLKCPMHLNSLGPCPPALHTLDKTSSEQKQAKNNQSVTTPVRPSHKPTPET